MPYQIRKVRGKDCYSVKLKSPEKKNKTMKTTNKAGKTMKQRRVFSKCTTQEKAKKQLRLLNALHYNAKFVPNKK